jgi:hypothetical protein
MFPNALRRRILPQFTALSRVLRIPRTPHFAASPGLAPGPPFAVSPLGIMDSGTPRIRLFGARGTQSPRGASPGDESPRHAGHLQPDPLLEEVGQRRLLVLDRLFQPGICLLEACHIPGTPCSSSRRARETFLWVSSPQVGTLVSPVAGALKITSPRGGRVTFSRCERPCQATGSAMTPPRLPWPLPP